MKDAEKDIAAMIAADNVAEDELEEEEVIVFTDEDGHEHAFYEEEQFVVGKNTYAILVGLPEDACTCGEEDCHCHDHEDGDEDDEVVILAKIEFDAEGAPVYVEPSEAEFAEAKEAYDKLGDE